MPLIDSLIAVFLVIAAGWGLKASGVLAANHWQGVERLTYQVLFPAVVIATLAGANLGSLPLAAVGGSLVGAILIVAAALYLLQPALRAAGVSGPAFTSVLQGSVRWNTFVALALAAGLYGRDGATLMAIAVASMIPLLNVMCVLTLVRFAGGRPMTTGQTLRVIATNPFIWSSALGLALNLVNAFLPASLLQGVDILGRAALGVGLLVVGAGIELRRLAQPRLPHAVAIVLKLVAMPLIAWSLARALGVEGAPLTITVIAAAVPTATAAYFLAREMGGDAPLMAEITTLQTVLAMVTLPVALLILT